MKREVKKTLPFLWLVLSYHTKKLTMDKGNFFTGHPVFSQLLNLIPRATVERLSRKHGGNHYCKRFMTYDHLVAMLYAGYFQCNSLRELITGLQANASRLHHLGLKHTP